MKAMRANLAHFYQQSNLLVLYFVFGITAIPMFIFWKNYPFEISVIFAAGIYGMGSLISTHYIDTLTKPMVFCLPGHALILRKILFQAGFIVSVISAVFFTIHNTNNFTEMPYRLLIYGSLYMLFWTVGLRIASVVRINSNFGLFIALGFGIGYLIRYVPIEHFLFSSYGSIIVLLACVCCWNVWKHLGRADTARRYCNQPKISLFFMSEEKAAQRIQKERVSQITMSEEKAGDIVERFFLPKITCTNSHPVIPFLWGAVYQSYGRFITQHLQGGWILLFFFVLPLFTILGYTNDNNSFGINYMIAIFVFGQHFDLNLYHPFFIKQGRNQRFWSSIAILATGVAVISLLVTVLFFLMLMISSYMPEINLMGKNTFNPNSFLILYLIPILLPTGATLNILFPRRIGMKLICFFALTTASAAIAILIKSSNINLSLAEGVLLLLLTSWGTFAVILYWTCFHRTLSVKKNGEY